VVECGGSDGTQCRVLWLCFLSCVTGDFLSATVLLLFPQVDQALWAWCEHVINSKGYLSDDVLINKALKFAERFGVNKDTFKASNGWLQRFKDRHNLKLKALHGEATTVSEGDIEGERKRLKDLISQYDPDDVYNADETALFWRMAPKKTLSNNPRPGEKMNKDRVSVMLGCNLTGTVATVI
jgi:hypothetical protein